MAVDEAVLAIDAADEKMAAAAKADEAAGHFWLTHSVSIARLSFRLRTKLFRSHSHTLHVQDKWQHEPATAFAPTAASSVLEGGWLSDEIINGFMVLLSTSADLGTCERRRCLAARGARCGRKMVARCATRPPLPGEPPGSYPLACQYPTSKT
jgi:hypothetical protein